MCLISPQCSDTVVLVIQPVKNLNLLWLFWKFYFMGTRQALSNTRKEWHIHFNGRFSGELGSAGSPISFLPPLI